MALDELQQPNIGKPDFATGASTAERKVWAIVTTVAFAVFWVYLLWILASFVGEAGMHWSAPVLCLAGLVLGLWGRRQIENR